MVVGKINNEEVKLTVDTGANATIIRHGLLTGCKVLPASKSFRLQTASGALIPVRGEAWIKLQIGTAEFNHKVLVAEITDDCILGIDFMASHGLIVNIKKRYLGIGQETVP